MKLVLTLAAVFAAFGFAPRVFAYSIADLQRDARAYHGNVAARVGDLRLEQEMTFMSPSGKDSKVASTFLRKGAKWRSEGSISMPGLGGKSGSGSIDAVTVFDGKDVWTVAMGMKTKLPAGSAPQNSAAYWIDPADGSTVVGEEKVGGVDCWIVQGPKIDANPVVSMGPTRSWIDKNRFIFTQTESELSGKTIRTVFSDVRKVDGNFEIPHRMEIFSDGTKTAVATVTKVHTKAALAEDLFDAAKLGGAGMTGPGGMPAGIDLDAIMKQAEQMKKNMSEGAGKTGK